MKQRAQAGLEYLMTYGWALIIIATVIGVVVLLVDTPEQDGFSSSDPANILLKGSTIEDSTVRIALQNLVGGKIEITDISSTGDLIGCTINDEVALTIGAGGIMTLECVSIPNPTGSGAINGSVIITYIYSVGLEKTIVVSPTNEVEKAYTLIESCPYLINGPGENEGRYMLNDELSNTGTCVTIAADNIVLDCDDEFITAGGSGSGVYATNVSNITIRNCRIGLSGKGINLVNVTNGLIANNTLNKNDEAIYVNQGTYTIVNNTIGNGTNEDENDYGIVLSSVNNSTIRGNIIDYFEERGISLTNSNSNAINRNTISHADEFVGIFFSSSSNNVLESNVLSGNFLGMTVRDNSQNNTLNNNEICDSLSDDLECEVGSSLDGSGNQVTNIDGVCGTVTYSPCT